MMKIIFFLIASFSLSLSKSLISSHETFIMGSYRLILKDGTLFPFITIFKGSKEILATSNQESWIILADAVQNRPPIQDGNYQVSYELKRLSNSLTIENIKQSDSLGIELTGILQSCASERECNEMGKFYFSMAEEGEDLRFSLKVLPSQPVNEIHTLFSFRCERDETFHGFGESFTYFDLTGLNVPILVSEQGVGRDEQPITDYLNRFVGEGVGGHWYTTYAPKPLFLTNKNRSLGLNITETSFFDLTRVKSDGLVQVELWTGEMEGKIFSADRLTDLVSAVSGFTGRQSPLPKWTQNGAIVGLEGGTENVTRIVDTLLDGGVAIAGVWLQDWVGLRHSWDGDRLIWNWEVNYDHYPNWQEMVSNWRKRGIRVLNYLNPFFSDPTGFVNETELRHNFYKEGLERGFFVKRSDGSPYLMNSLSIEFATLDLTNPSARDWMKAIIINQTLVEAQSSGWMCDFGEYLPFDAVMSDGRLGASFHNFYPQAWAELTAEAIQEYNQQQGIAAEDNEIMYFMRSAWTFSPSFVPVFWLGDQLMSWDGNDGIKTVIKGALSSGLTGHAITHSDIGGYTAEIYNISDLTFIRSPELLKRWSELSAFGFGLFRTHIGSSTSPMIAQVYDDADSIAHFARFSQIFATLADYRLDLMREASVSGWPLLRPLVFYAAFDSESWKIDFEYFFGFDFLVAPCQDEAKNSTTVYFPPLPVLWRSIWSSDEIVVDMRDQSRGSYRTIASPIGFPPVFFRDGSQPGQRLAEFIRDKNWQLPHSHSRSIA